MLSAAAPVAAQTTIWSATLTVEDLAQNISRGCSVHVSGKECSGLLSVNTFTFEGQTYEVTAVSHNANSGSIFLLMTPAITDSMLGWSLRVGSTSLSFASAVTLVKSEGRIAWANSPSIAVGDMVSVSLIAPGGGGAAPSPYPHVVVPLAPDAPQLEAGPGALGVSWSPPAARAGGTLAACWVLRYSDDGGRSWTTVPHYSTTPAATLESLTAGQSYLVRVAALVGGRTGFWSPSTAATPAAVPDEPATPDGPTTPGSADTADGSTTPGSADGPDTADGSDAPGSADAADEPGTDTAEEPDASGSADASDEPDTADGPDGPDAAEATEEAAPPEVPAAPGIPEDLAVAAGPGTLTLTWSAPEDDGAAPLLGYAVEYGTSNIVYHRWSRPDALTAHTSATIDGLTGDQLHYARVAAVGCAGRSLWATPATATPTVAPPTAPGAPTTPTVTPGPGTLTVTWAAPAHDGGFTVRAYLIEYSTDAGATWTTRPHTTATTRTNTATLEGLAGDVAHHVRVRAANAVGAGEPSPTATATPTTAAPDRPATPTVTPGPGTLAVIWAAPHHNGAPITAYTIEYSTDRGHTWTPWPHTTTATATVLTDLTPGRRHQIRITATNTAGTSRPSPTHNTTPH